MAKRLNKNQLKQLILEQYRDTAKPESGHSREIPDPRQVPTSEDAKVFRALGLEQSGLGGGKLTFHSWFPIQDDARNTDIWTDLWVISHGSKWTAIYDRGLAEDYLDGYPEERAEEEAKNFTLQAEGATLKEVIQKIIQQGIQGNYKDIAPLVQAMEPSNLNRLLEYLSEPDGPSVLMALRNAGYEATMASAGVVIIHNVSYTPELDKRLRAIVDGGKLVWESDPDRAEWLPYLYENVSLDIDVGDVLLGGKWKNKRIVVKSIGKDELGQPTINGQSLLAMRIEKDMPKDKQSKKTRDSENG